MKASLQKLDTGLYIKTNYKDYSIHTDIYLPDEENDFVVVTNIFKDKVLVFHEMGTATEIVNKILEFLNK